ncbi:MAG: hypothetical protein E4H16_03245 [Candidatus Atribacteria bacterium]|nr:MAG: hypothetical protein E4H16_03245 [Candidatus Atribacteria bacterium]
MPQKTEDLKYDINLIKAQFDVFDIVKDILQPDSYEFTYSSVKWLAPSIYKEYQEAVKQEQLKKKLEDRKKSDTGRSDRGGARTAQRGGDRSTRSTRGADSRRGNRNQPAGRPEMMARGMDRGAMDPRDPRLREMGIGPGQGTKSPKEIEGKMRGIVLDSRKPLDRLETLTIWAHDDAIPQPGEYRYRMRIGVFNPIGGRDWFYPEQEEYKDQVVLWSQYSPPTEAVQIYPMIEFFPQFVAADTKDTVKIEVSKYYHGKWRTKDFDVRVGELIGKTVEEQPEVAAGMERMLMPGGRNLTPEKIPYETGAVLVDVITTNRWLGRGSLQEQEYEEILYSKDGSFIHHLSVRERNWPEELKQIARVIKEAKTTEQQGVGEGQMRPEMMGPEMMGMDPMMMQMMMRGPGGGGR